LGASTSDLFTVSVHLLICFRSVESFTLAAAVALHSSLFRLYYSLNMAKRQAPHVLVVCHLAQHCLGIVIVAVTCVCHRKDNLL